MKKGEGGERREEMKRVRNSVESQSIYIAHMCTHSQAQGSDADSVVPLYLPSTHWQLADPVALVKLYSGQDAHASLLCPSLNVPLGHSVQYK